MRQAARCSHLLWVSSCLAPRQVRRLKWLTPDPDPDLSSVGVSAGGESSAGGGESSVGGESSAVAESSAGAESVSANERMRKGCGGQVADCRWIWPNRQAIARQRKQRLASVI